MYLAYTNIAFRIIQEYMADGRWSEMSKDINVSLNPQIIIDYNNNQKMLILFLLPLTLLLPQPTTPAKTINIKAAVQNQDQTYFSYLPYNSACNYSQASMYPGEVRIQLLDSMRLYEEMEYQGMLVFWTPVYNGFALMMLLPQYIAPNYTGSILYDSKVKFPTRPLLLYTLTNSSNLTFYYTLPTIDIHTSSLSIRIVNQVQVEFDEQGESILAGCGNVGQDNFAFIGQGMFLFVCGETETGFVFSGEGGNVTVINFSHIGPGSYQLAPNPYILSQLGQHDPQVWNAMILANTSAPGTTLYFFIFNFETLNYTLLSLKEMQPAINLLINRIWGMQIKKEFNRWMDLFTSFNITDTKELFPGDIVSVFVSDHDNIFVEYSTVAGINFLCVFDGEGTLIWNVTYLGSIVYYGNRAIFIYNKLVDKIYFIEVDRPIYTLNVSNINDTTVDTLYFHNITIPCQNNTFQIEYQVLWTTADFPTAYILYKNSTPIYTTDVIYGFQVGERFEVIGPDFELIINSPPTVQVIIIDSSTIVINEAAIGIVNVEVYNGNYMTVIFVTNNSIYSVNSRLTKKTLAIQPCGFNTIKNAVKTGTNDNTGYIITNNKNQQCQCSSDFVACHLVTNNQLYAGLMGSLTAGNMYGSPEYQSYLRGMGNNLGGAGNVSVKRNLYALIGQGYIISILENNTVLLTSVKKLKVLDAILVPCLHFNQTNGDVFIKQFYDPFLILYCEQSSSLFQFIIRRNQLVAQRVIPLYRFVTRAGSYSFFPAFSFIFIAVDPLIDVFPLPRNCCVLRLDPCQFTVSVIIEIVQANSIIGVTNYRNIDIALFRSSSDEDSQYIIKAYFPNIWITLNQTNHTAIVDYQNVTVIFESRNYNFAASFDLKIVFNLTDINLDLVTNPQKQAAIQQLNLNFQPSSTKYGPVLIGSANYSLSDYVCGPIFTSYFYRKVHNMTNLEIVQSDVITRTKVLSNLGIDFIQLINPSKFGVLNLTLNNLILAVSVDRMFVYVKVLNEVQMVFIGNFHLPERRCTYYLLDVLNATAATLTANCEGLNFDYRSPLLTINYIPETTNFTHSYQWIVVPLDLRQIYTIVRGGNQSTLVIGIIEGPMNSATGRLFLCDLNDCSPLYISTSDAFLISYAAQVSDELYIVMSIDYQSIQIFVNPEVQPNQEPINSNYTINYIKYVNEPYCSVLKILNITETYSYNVLSCSNYYYYIRIDFIPETIQIITNFSRYSQCSLEDEFKPSAIYNQQGLQVLFAACRQNDYMFRLQAYQTINSSTPIIYTGYLQVFVMSGPKGPNCSPLSTSASKIIPLSTSMEYSLFMTYSILDEQGNITHKFIYSQISGVLIDNIIQLQPSITVQYQPFVLQYSYPSILFYAINQFHHISQQINTNQLSTNRNIGLNIVAFTIFTISNLITIVCLICFLCQRGQRNVMLKMQQNRDSTGAASVGDELQYDDSGKGVLDVPVASLRKRETTANISAKKSANRPSQIEMYFVKRK